MNVRLWWLQSHRYGHRQNLQTNSVFIEIPSDQVNIKIGLNVIKIFLLRGGDTIQEVKKLKETCKSATCQKKSQTI